MLLRIRGILLKTKGGFRVLKRKYFFVIIFLIVYCLLSFTEISYLAEKPSDYGEFWNILSEHEKQMYLLGMRDGMKTVTTNCIKRFGPYLSKEKESQLAGIDFLTEYKEYINFLSSSDPTILKVMTDLYKDPANTYIFFVGMVGIAYQKLKGEDIEPLLQEARKEALQ